MFTYKIKAKDPKSRARTGEFITPHGTLCTPALATVATAGAVKAIAKEKLAKQKLPLLIVNTFHLFTKGIIDQLPPGKTVHDYACFDGPMESDSGGFQVFSLGFARTHNVGKIGGFFPGKEHQDVDLNNPLKITDEGVSFTYDEKIITLTPEKSIELQQKIGADIIFAFDECTSPLNSHAYTKQAMERTHQWLKRCLIYLKKTVEDRKWRVEGNEDGGRKIEYPSSINHIQRPLSSFHHLSSTTHPPQALFAIVQGGYFKDLRTQSAKFVGKQDVPGFGIGGSLGKTKEEMLQVIDWTIPHLPEEKPRHLLGIGQVKDIFEAVDRGVDLFDCVIPTREARHKVAYTKHGKLELRKNKDREEPIETDCSCEACSDNITIEQLWRLFLLKDPLAYYYTTVHNIHFFSALMKKIQESIQNRAFQQLKNTYLRYY